MMCMSRTVVVILDVDDTMPLSAHSILFPLLTRFCSIVFALACTPLFLIVVVVFQVKKFDLESALFNLDDVADGKRGRLERGLWVD